MSKLNSTDSRSCKISLEKIVADLRDEKYKNVVFMVGAGISTAAGIPDFRTPGSGLYDNLEKLKLPYPEAVFDIDFFAKQPNPFYTLAKELYPGQFEPTKFHNFIKWVDDHGMLKRVYTQNIDTLERMAGIDETKIVEAHGSFANNHCIECNHVPPPTFVSDLVLKSDKVTIPKCPKCSGLVKPDIVFFGEGLPEIFFESMEQDFDGDVDLVICAGTSLQVQPFAQLPDMVDRNCHRLLLNAERVGSFGSRKKDVVAKCNLAEIEDLFPFLAKESKELPDAPQTPAQDASIDTSKDVSEVAAGAPKEAAKTPKEAAKAPKEATETSPKEHKDTNSSDIAEKLSKLDIN